MAKAPHSHISSALDALPLELDAEQDAGAPPATEPAAKVALSISPSLPATIKDAKIDFDFGDMPANYQARIRKLEHDLDDRHHPHGREACRDQEDH